MDNVKMCNVKMCNVKMCGSTDSKDCFYENDCNKRWHWGCKSISALTIGYFATSGKDPLPKSTSAIPMHKIKKDGSYGGKLLTLTYNSLTLTSIRVPCLPYGVWLS